MACRPGLCGIKVWLIESFPWHRHTTIVPQQCGIHHSGSHGKGKMRLSGRQLSGAVRGGREVFKLDFEASSARRWPSPVPMDPAKPHCCA